MLKILPVLLLLCIFTVYLLTADQGNAASQPSHPAIAVVAVDEGLLLGGWQNGKWVKDADCARVMQVRGSFNLYSLDRLVGTAAGRNLKHDNDMDVYNFNFDKLPAKSDGLLAISSSVNALPRKVEVLGNSNATYIAAVRQLLQTKGINNPIVHITRLVRCDIDSDGVKEVVISATTPNPTYIECGGPIHPGDYSCVLLRKVVSKSVKTIMVSGEFYPTAPKDTCPNEYLLTHVLDLNDDGKMEIVVFSHYYEGSYTAVYSVENDTVREVFGVGIGV